MTINENVVLTTVVTYDEWLLHAEEIKSRMGTSTNIIFAMACIKDHPKIVGFMTEPVALYNDKVIEAKTMIVNDISTLPEVLTSLPNDIVMYVLLRHLVMPADSPNMCQNWYIRYAEVTR